MHQLRPWSSSTFFFYMTPQPMTGSRVLSQTFLNRSGCGAPPLTTYLFSGWHRLVCIWEPRFIMRFPGVQDTRERGSLVFSWGLQPFSEGGGSSTGLWLLHDKCMWLHGGGHISAHNRHTQPSPAISRHTAMTLTKPRCFSWGCGPQHPPHLKWGRYVDRTAAHLA